MPYEHPSQLPPGVAVTPSAAHAPKAAKADPEETRAARREGTLKLTRALVSRGMDLATLVRKGWTDEARDLLPEIRADIEKLENLLRHEH
jgi:hypothetical protein